MPNITSLTEKQTRMIQHVLTEMVNTETTYLDILSQLEKKETAVLSQAANALTAYDQILLKQGFDFIRTISTASKDILSIFKAIQSEPFLHTVDNVEELQTIIAEMKKTYANYCVFYEIFLSKLSSNIGSETNIDAHELSGLLAAPFQRQPRYAMLFNELLKHVPKEHPQRALYEQLLSSFKQNAADINAAMAAYENPTMQISALDFGNDTQFRRRVKLALTSVLMTEPSSRLAELLDEHSFTIQTRSKQFSNKRSYDIVGTDNNRLVSFVVNRHSLSIQLSGRFSDLHDVEKQALLKLQFLVCFGIEGALKVHVNQDLKHKLNILGDIDFVTQSSDVEVDDSNIASSSSQQSNRSKVYKNPFSQDYKDTLMRLMTENKGLSRQGSFRRQNNIEQVNKPKRIALPGLA